MSPRPISAACLLAFSALCGAVVLDLSSARVEASSYYIGAVGIARPKNPELAFDASDDLSSFWLSDNIDPQEPQWIWVDLGRDRQLLSVGIDWASNMTDYTLRLRTAAQGPSADPNAWSIIAGVSDSISVVADWRVGQGGPLAGFDEAFDFGMGHVNSAFEGVGDIVELYPEGRYLMIYGIDPNVASYSVYDVRVSVIPEPCMWAFGALAVTVLLTGRSRKGSRL